MSRIIVRSETFQTTLVYVQLAEIISSTITSVVNCFVFILIYYVEKFINSTYSI